MGNVISNLKAKFGVDTSDFKKGLKDGERAVGDFKGAAGDQIEQFADMFGVNMSGVSSAVGTASKSLNFLKNAFLAAAAGGDILTISARVLKVALVSTGLGAIVVALGSIAAYFISSGRGADTFSKILMQVKSVINNVIERLAIFGKGLYEIATGKFKAGWETMRGAFKGIGDEIKEDWKEAGKLADAEDALEDREIALINSLSARKAKAAELRQQAKEEMEDQKKKLVLLNEAEALVKSVYADQISLEKERLRLMKEKLKMQSADPTDEQRRAIAEQEAKVNDLLRERADELRALLKEKNKVIAANEKELAQFRSYSNIKMPQLFNKKAVDNLQTTLKSLHHTFIQLKDETSALYEVMGKVAVDAAGALNDAFSSGAEGMGEFLGALMTGEAGIGGFGKLIAATFADLAINVGKIAIGAGLAVLGVKKALMTLNPWVAIAAGVALVAIGSAIKGSLASAASGGSGSASGVGSGGGGSLGITPMAQQKEFIITLTGELVAKGADLVYVVDKENNRRKNST
jgi:hypothetical protein